MSFKVKDLCMWMISGRWLLVGTPGEADRFGEVLCEGEFFEAAMSPNVRSCCSEGVQTEALLLMLQLMGLQIPHVDEGKCMSGLLVEA